jgi:hypothetical protein
MRKPELKFATIDAKDCSPVTADDFNSPCIYHTNSKNNLLVIMEAEREYLERLAELQKEIKDEFEPKLGPEPKEPDFTHEEGWAIEKEIDEKPKRNKNINNLWYS